MKKHFTHFSTLLIILVLTTSCSGQVKTGASKDSLLEKSKTSVGYAKLIKTQNSDISDNVHCALQDKAGNLWFGTTGEGAYCYDGKTFTQFTINNGLISNTIYCMLEDKMGNIWFGTNKGLCRYNGKELIAMPINDNNVSITNDDNFYNDLSTKNTVWSLMQDKTGKIWIGTGNGVYCYDGLFFSHFLDNDGVINKNGLKLKMVDCILQDKQGIIWFASGMPPGMEGVCRYDGKEITSFKPNGDGWIRYIVEDTKGNLWFGGRNNGNFCYDGKTFKNFTEKVGVGNPILADKLGNIWFTGEEGKTNYESKDGIWCRRNPDFFDSNNEFFKNYSTKEGMGKYFVHCMFEDKVGNLWIGTRNTGLYRYDGKVFECFTD